MNGGVMLLKENFDDGEMCLDDPVYISSLQKKKQLASKHHR